MNRPFSILFVVSVRNWLRYSKEDECYWAKRSLQRTQRKSRKQIPFRIRILDFATIQVQFNGIFKFTIIIKYYIRVDHQTVLSLSKHPEEIKIVVPLLEQSLIIVVCTYIPKSDLICQTSSFPTDLVGRAYTTRKTFAFDVTNYASFN